MCRCERKTEFLSWCKDTFDIDGDTDLIVTYTNEDFPGTLVRVGDVKELPEKAEVQLEAA